MRIPSFVVVLVYCALFWLGCGSPQPLGKVAFGPTPARLTVKGDYSSVILVHIRIGDKDLALQLDTGDSQAIKLSPALAGELGVVYRGTTSWSQDSFGNTFNARDFIVSEIRLGDTVFTDVPGSEFLHRQGGDSEASLGHIGLGLFRTLCEAIGIDALGQSLFLYARSEATPNAVTWFQTHDGICTKANIGGNDVQLGWDSGASHSVLNESRAALFKDKLNTLGPYKVYGAPACLIDNVNIGAVEFVLLPLSGLPYDGLLGVDYFKNHAVFIDFKHSKVGIESMPR